MGIFISVSNGPWLSGQAHRRPWRELQSQQTDHGHGHGAEKSQSGGEGHWLRGDQRGADVQLDLRVRGEGNVA
jgi:hypothetical protein